jgi:hypothetical protein
MSKLWGTSSSNLTRFQLNRQGFVFFTRGGSKAFGSQPFCQLCIEYGLIFYKNDLVQFCNKYLVGPSQKNSFWALKKRKWFFCAKKMKTPFGNIVCHFNMPPCAKYEIIWTNYGMNVAMTLIIWLESRESSHMIAHFREHFFKIIAVLQVYYFSW